MKSDFKSSLKNIFSIYYFVSTYNYFLKLSGTLVIFSLICLNYPYTLTKTQVKYRKIHKIYKIKKKTTTVL